MNVSAAIDVGLVVKGISLTKLAQDMGMTLQGVRDIKRRNSTTRIDEMARVFGVPLSRFVEWGEMIDKEREALEA